MILGKLPVPGRPTSLDYSKTRAYCAYSRYGWGYLDIFSSAVFAEKTTRGRDRCCTFQYWS